LRGIELAPVSLLARMRGKGRRIEFVEEGSEELRWLDFMGVNANAGGEKLDHILLRAEPRIIEIWEEFLHGTQKRCGLIADTVAMKQAEIHVKRFMIRHRRLIGISGEDAAILEQMAASLEK
jgi:hypothetical protein